MCLQVEPPRRLRISPPVHGQGDQVRTVLEIADDHTVIPPGAAPSRRQPQRAPPPPLRTPQSNSATADTADRAVQRPSETDDPARGKTRTSNVIVGHRLTASDSRMSAFVKSVGRRSPSQGLLSIRTAPRRVRPSPSASRHRRVSHQGCGSCARQPASCCAASSRARPSRSPTGADPWLCWRRCRTRARWTGCALADNSTSPSGTSTSCPNHSCCPQAPSPLQRRPPAQRLSRAVGT